MKGVVFTEFIEMVEARFSGEVADRMIEACSLPSGGAYTAVATYDHRDLVSLVDQLSKLTGIPQSELIREFGRHLFGRFVVLFPRFFQGVTTPFRFLRGIDNYIHVEVRKLYPDAELPRFEYRDLGSGRMELLYSSTRPFADLADGLIQGCFEHFGVPVEITRENLRNQTGNVVRFGLTCPNNCPVPS